MQLFAKALGFLGPALESHRHEVDAGASATDEGKGLRILNISKTQGQYHCFQNVES